MQPHRQPHRQPHLRSGSTAKLAAGTSLTSLGAFSTMKKTPTQMVMKVNRGSMYRERV
jgi:hypothetical protein